MNVMQNVIKGDIYMVDFGQGIGSEIEGVRPAVIIQNNIGNKYSPITYVAPITYSMHKAKLMGNIVVSKEESSLPRDGLIDINQIRAIDKSRLNKYIGEVSNKTIEQFSNFMQFIVNGDYTMIKNNAATVTKYDDNDDVSIKTKTLQTLENFYSSYQRNNSFSSKFADNVFSSITDYAIVGIISFLLGLLFRK